MHIYIYREREREAQTSPVLRLSWFRISWWFFRIRWSAPNNELPDRASSSCFV